MLKMSPKKITRPSHFLIPVLILCILGGTWALKRNNPALQTKSATTAQEPFTIVALPDTQIYSYLYPEIFMKQTQWVADNLKAKNIVFVTHLGDIVESNTEEQWQNASKAMATLDGKIPYGIAPGNHDMTPEGSALLFNKYFPVSRLKQSTTWGGSFFAAKGNYVKNAATGDNNSYHLFSKGGIDFIALNLEFCPTDSELEWAGNMLETYKNRTAIVANHTFLNGSGERTDTQECVAYQHEGLNAGHEIWDYLINKRQLSNVSLFLNGHDINTTTGGARRTDTVQGRNVHQLFSNYQFLFGYTSGYLRLMTFYPEGKKIKVQTYSPVSDTYLTDADNQFELSM